MTERYILQPSSLDKGWWVLTDTEAGIVCRFENRRFNETQKVTILDEDKEALAKYSPVQLAGLLRAMADWALANHPEKLY